MQYLSPKKDIDITKKIGYKMNIECRRICFKERKMKKNMIKTMGLILLALSFTGTVWAAAFTINFSDIQVDNVPPGIPVSLLQKAAFTLGVNNVDTLSSNMFLEVTAPGKSRVKEGYEPIPDVSWIKFDRESCWVKPNQTENFNMIVYAPYSEKLFGKKYEAILTVYTLEGILKVNIKSKVFISFTAERFPPETIQQKIEGDQSGQVVMINPKVISVPEVNIKRDFDLSKLVITNNSSEKITLNLYAIGLANVPAAAGLFSFKNPRIELNTKESKTIDISVNLPLLKLKKSEQMLIFIGARDTKNPPVLEQFSLLTLQFD